MLPSLLVIVYKSVVDNPIVMAAEIASAPDSGSNWLHRLFVGSAGKGLALIALTQHLPFELLRREFEGFC